MADTRQNPREGKSPRAKSQYHIFSETAEGSLTKLGTFEGRNAEDAVSGYLGQNGESPDSPLVIVPDRNLTRVQVKVEERRPKVSLAKV